WKGPCVQPNQLLCPCVHHRNRKLSEPGRTLDRKSRITAAEHGNGPQDRQWHSRYSVPMNAFFSRDGRFKMDSGIDQNNRSRLLYSEFPAQLSEVRFPEVMDRFPARLALTPVQKLIA